MTKRKDRMTIDMNMNEFIETKCIMFLKFAHDSIW